MYEQYAMGADELRPLTLKGKTVFGDMGATLVDSLDTLWMMGLREEFDRCTCHQPSRFSTKQGLQVCMAMADASWRWLTPRGGGLQGSAVGVGEADL